MRPGEFRATCRIGKCWENPSVFVNRVGRDDFVRHMLDEHGRRLLPDHQKRVRSGGFPSTPAPGRGRAARLPLGMQPGDVITFRDRDEHCERRGTVWSAGQQTNQVWVIPETPAETDSGPLVRVLADKWDVATYSGHKGVE